MDRQTLLERLREAGKPINLKVTTVSDADAARSAVVAVVGEKTPEWGESKSVAAWRHPLIDRLGLEEALGRLDVPLRITEPLDPSAGCERGQAERERQRSGIIASFIGVTAADFCMADTATLVMRNRPGQPRSVALVPSIHIAVITLDQIVADMKDLFALLRWDDRYRPEGLSNYMLFHGSAHATIQLS